MAMLLGPLFAIVIFYSRKFHTDNELSIVDVIAAAIPITTQVVLTALVFVQKLHSQFLLLPIASLCVLVLELFFHLIPFTEFLYSKATGEKLPFASLNPKGVGTTFDDLGMLTDDEVEKMLLASPKRSARGDM